MRSWPSATWAPASRMPLWWWEWDRGLPPGQDCHAVIETMRGHTLGRVIYHGSALPNTGVPGLVGGFAGERVLRAPAAGYFHPLLEIGAQVRQGDTAATVAGVPMLCTLDGILRGILPEGTPVYAGMKAGDIDPRCRLEHCFTASEQGFGGWRRCFRGYSPSRRYVENVKKTPPTDSIRRGESSVI